ncbi:MAG: hypothetical protein D6701_08460 [Gemmatimonadetes bacterium]|nr:MAG: hypothetical protein D6701_08460 [Gemmatimonadota bacterium]
MPLRHLIYRCPECGHDPVLGEGDRAHCDGCGTSFERGERSLVRVIPAGTPPHGAPCRTARELIEAIDGHGGPLPPGRDGYAADALRRTASRHRPLKRRGRVLGFYEALGAPEAGVLAIDADTLRFRPTATEGEVSEWRLLDLRAVQTSSAAVQVTDPRGTLVQFQFPVDSPRRWEQLLHRFLRAAYQRAGRGEILEFQPRIVTR